MILTYVIRRRQFNLVCRAEAPQVLLDWPQQGRSIDAARR